MKRWTVGLVFCFLLVGASKASAAYIVVENISQGVPNWGDCSCHPATGWLTALIMSVTVPDADGGTYDLLLLSADYGNPKKTVKPVDNLSIFLVDITKTNPLAPSGSYTSKKIIGLPDSGFAFTSQNQRATIGMHFCAAAQDSCGGYSTGSTDPFSLFITPGLSGSDSVEFQVPAPNSIAYSVVRVTFYPGNPPPRGKNQ